ncbi:hypothetical protein M5U04_16830 [Xenorhabdus sp. XENO-1]|uniref:hypothetical protein n=1 Tax=Xenorhabdus bovienii TaxID=40576 RepID=UPI0020CA417F|nr:hypothetical protein [Xenorhabdus bovienii]MCP9269701.1 hypothetical protein [Xenorhabdus bovienii subsp. africana]
MKDNLESIFDNFFGELERKQRKNFWSNREPKQRITQQERDTINVFTSFIPAVNGAQSKERVSTKTKTRRRLESGGVTVRG